LPGGSPHEYTVRAERSAAGAESKHGGGSLLLAALLAFLVLAPSPSRAEEPCAPVKPCELGDELTAEEEPADLSVEARQLHDLVACQGKVPAGLDAAAVKAFCARLAPAVARREAQVRRPLDAHLSQPRPARIPSAAVYPLSGADLLPALEAFPEARNLTTVSPLPAGDPRALLGLRKPGELKAALGSLAADAERLLRGEPVQKAPAHGILPLLIWALAVDGQEPTGLKLLQVEPAGTLRYLGKSELAKGGAAYASCELAFARRGAAGGPPRYLRHLAADLADSADPGPLAHLATKGDVAVLLSRAGALAGEPYGRLRALLLKRGAFVVSDGTGLPPAELEQAGLRVESRPRPGGGTLVVARRP